MNEAIEVVSHHREQIRSFLERHVRGVFQDSVDLFATGRMNSLFALQLVLFVEKQFRVRVESEDLELKNFRSVDAIDQFVERKLALR